MIHMPLERTCILQVAEYSVNVNSMWLVNASIHFHNTALSVHDRGLLKPVFVIIDLSISPLHAVSFALYIFEGLLLPYTAKALCSLQTDRLSAGDVLFCMYSFSLPWNKNFDTESQDLFWLMMEHYIIFFIL